MKLMLTYPKNRKNSKMGNLIIFEKFMTVQSCQNFEKIFKYFTNWFQSIFEFSVQKLCCFNRKISQAKKSKIQNSVWIEKKLFRKSSAKKFLNPLGE
jgi:hypothetical protein